jgi:hypothetical protein
MKSKEEIVHAMCMTERHDYGLNEIDAFKHWVM